MEHSFHVYQYIVDMAIPLLISASIWIAIKVSSMSKSIEKLLEMHEHPDDTGFGTVRLEDSLKEINYGIRAMVHYMKWLAKEQTGKNPPPSTYHQNGDTDL